MRLAQAWIVARHDLRLALRRRAIVAGLIALPVGVGLGFPALLAYILAHNGSTGAASWLPGLADAFSLWFVIGAAGLPTSIASYSLVGEKTSKSLETLLSTSTTDGELLLGKGLAAWLPAVGAMGVGGILFQVAADLATRGALGFLLYPSWQMAVLLLLAMPLASLLAVEAAVLISARVADVRSAQQLAGLIFFPFIVLYIAGEIGFPLNATNMLYVSLGLAGIDLALFYGALRSFRREEILTKWK